MPTPMGTAAQPLYNGYAFEYNITDTAITSTGKSGIVSNNCIVFLMGSLTLSPQSNWNNGHVLFTVPEKARPTNMVNLPAFMIPSGGTTADWQIVPVRITSNGNVTLRVPLNAGTYYLYLNGLMYSVNDKYYKDSYVYN